MTKAQETRFSNLLRKKTEQTLQNRDASDFKSLLALKTLETKACKSIRS